MHVARGPQLVPHAPQCSTVLERSTHVPEHTVVFDSGQLQEPATQLPPVGHALPHAPQWSALVCRSTQLVPHAVVLAATHLQALPVHVAPAGQTLPHVPQLFGSALISMQREPQARSGGQPHAPATHTNPTSLHVAPLSMTASQSSSRPLHTSLGFGTQRQQLASHDHDVGQSLVTEHGAEQRPPGRHFREAHSESATHRVPTAPLERAESTATSASSAWPTSADASDASASVSLAASSLGSVLGSLLLHPLPPSIKRKLMQVNRGIHGPLHTPRCAGRSGSSVGSSRHFWVPP